MKMRLIVCFVCERSALLKLSVEVLLCTKFLRKTVHFFYFEDKTAAKLEHSKFVVVLTYNLRSSELDWYYVSFVRT